MFKMQESKLRKAWPKDCVWPEPLHDGWGMQWDADDVELMDLDEDGRDLMEIKEYFDSLVECGRLNEDYSLNEYYEDDDRYGSDEDDQSDDDYDGSDEEFEPEIGQDYWDDGFDVDMWEEDLSDHMNLLKLDMDGSDVPGEIREIIGYEFINENLLRQAFTRRAFAVEYGLSGCSEELEFLGDSVLDSVVTREIIKQFTDVDTDDTYGPFWSKFNEGEFTRIRSMLVSKEHLAERASVLGLDRFILYGTGEEPTESSREDTIEALIGAVTIDSGWDQGKIDSVVDRLICIQLGDPDRYLKATYYDLFNQWHQKHFGKIPEYEIYSNGKGQYECSMRYFIPENDKDIWGCQRVDMKADTRSRARELAAEMAYRFVTKNGLWMNLREADVVPDVENSINQLQELYQKKYVEEKPVYEFEQLPENRWECDCTCGGMFGYGRAENKTLAKKRAAYMVLIHLLDSAGICKEEWRKNMYEGLY